MKQSLIDKIYVVIYFLNQINESFYFHSGRHVNNIL